jgi:hypothetical protein
MGIQLISLFLLFLISGMASFYVARKAIRIGFRRLKSIVSGTFSSLLVFSLGSFVALGGGPHGNLATAFMPLWLVITFPIGILCAIFSVARIERGAK